MTYFGMTRKKRENSPYFRIKESCCIASKIDIFETGEKKEREKGQKGKKKKTFKTKLLLIHFTVRSFFFFEVNQSASASEKATHTHFIITLHTSI